ncbi:DUF2478 domain-containing protein [Gluconacetobacter diazotrophicus]|uniref:DUF2478 domain-containing protein n=2 Tax=Gluconacetobacter diazotrophicus TaxID=33996 RepID=A0A7W4I6X3_GLUDI|nr:DUF2478 domain-containing protein [Gluconacetobacter diazotrophicus]
MRRRTKGGQTMTGREFSIATLLHDSPQATETRLSDAVAVLRSWGMPVGGFVQRRGPLRPDGRHEMYVEDLRDGGRIRLDRYRGPGAVACTLDMEAMAVLSMTLRAHIRARPDILFVNRFGVREAEGGGLREDIAQAVCENIPIVVVVGAAHLQAWRRFIGQDAHVLPSTTRSLLDWARRQVPMGGSGGREYVATAP